jgi:hypothetical protein
LETGTPLVGVACLHDYRSSLPALNHEKPGWKPGDREHFLSRHKARLDDRIGSGFAGHLKIGEDDGSFRLPLQ